MKIRSLSAAKVRKIIQKIAFLRELTLFPHKYFAFGQERRYIEDGNSPRDTQGLVPVSLGKQ